MKLTKLVLRNFGVYAGMNIFDFETGKPVILIGGMNGRGKTTLLESILLALYGQRSFAFTESKLSYPAYLKKLVNITDHTYNASVEIEFVIGFDETSNAYRLVREWSSLGSKNKDKIRVYKNGKLDDFLSANWGMYIEELIPSAVSNFFFFDGEKISELASESTDEQLRNSIKTLLGIDTLDRLETDLEKILTAKSKKLTTTDNQAEIDELQDTIEIYEEQLDEIHTEIATCTTENNKFNREIALLEATFVAKGGNIQNDKAKLYSEKNRLTEELKAASERLVELASDELPLALVKPLLSRIYTDAKREQTQRNEQLATQRMEELIDDFTKQSKSQASILNKLLNFIKGKMALAEEVAPPQYSLSDNGLFQAQMLSNSFLDHKVEEAVKLLKRRTELQAELERIENYLEVDVDESTISTTIKKIKTLTKSITENEERKRSLELEMMDVEVKKEAAERSRLKLVEKALAELESNDDSVRIAQYSQKAIQLLKAYRKRLQEQKTTALAEAMTACYKRIASKTSLVDRIEISPATLDIVFYDKDGKHVNKNILSAGEQQLRAIALLWALAICSHNILPVIIDTPLARLDSQHREKMVTAYFPNASEQTIILSTDAEIDEKNYALLKPFIGKEYTLNYNDTTQSTSVQKGYFGGEQA
jgi:DNA sulfur modification protein DndD